MASFYGFEAEKGDKNHLLKRCCSRAKCFIDINVKIYLAGKLLTPLQLEKEYQDWLLQMHDHYDEENNFGAGQPIFIISPKNKKSLGISSDGRP
ncbi:hypothetical protein Patl1_37620 [Pistacia atlantica]|nr:hypothetical protein Patl1_37620 [Pistacia atlantica]